MDLDGTLTKPFKDLIDPTMPDQIRASVTPYRPSLLMHSNCFEPAPELNNWDGAIFCDETVTLRSIWFANPTPFFNFQAVNIEVRLLNDPYENITNAPQE